MSFLFIRHFTLTFRVLSLTSPAWLLCPFLVSSSSNCQIVTQACSLELWSWSTGPLTKLTPYSQQKAWAQESPIVLQRRFSAGYGMVSCIGCLVTLLMEGIERDVPPSTVGTMITMYIFHTSLTCLPNAMFVYFIYGWNGCSWSGSL